MRYRQNMIGRKYNRLTIIADAPDYISPAGYQDRCFFCKCDCGKVIKVRRCNLWSGGVKSCGCLHRETLEKNWKKFRKHGLYKDPLYKMWKNIRGFCTNPKHVSWPYYGGRGISVCSEWDDFTAFRSWALSQGWEKGLVIGRIDRFKDYSPENCRVVTLKESLALHFPSGRRRGPNGHRFAKEEHSPEADTP